MRELTAGRTLRNPLLGAARALRAMAKISKLRVF